METQSMMILESFAAGLPVIGVDKYAIPDLVRHESTGFIARAFDIEELKRLMPIQNNGTSAERIARIGNHLVEMPETTLKEIHQQYDFVTT